MKIGLLFGLLSCLFSLKVAYAQSSLATMGKQDSLPPGQTTALSMHRYRLPLTIGTNPGNTKQLITIVVHSNKLRLGNEIALPVGVDERTVVVISGDRVCSFGKIMYLSLMQIASEFWTKTP